MKIDEHKKENGWSVRAGDGDEPDFGEEHDVGLVTQEAEPELKRPPMYKVILLNDDYTPMEFVVHILEIFFGMNREGDSDHADCAYRRWCSGRHISARYCGNEIRASEPIRSGE